MAEEQKISDDEKSLKELIKDFMTLQLNEKKAELEKKEKKPKKKLELEGLGIGLAFAVPIAFIVGLFVWIFAGLIASLFVGLIVVTLIVGGFIWYKKQAIWIPFKARVGRVKQKKGYATWMIIGENRNVSFQKQKIDDQTVMIDGVPRIATPDDVLSYKRRPLVILPSWSVKPFSPTDNYADTVKNQYTTQGFKLLLNSVEAQALKPKKKFSIWVILIILAVIAVAGYFAYTQGWFS